MLSHLSLPTHHAPLIIHHSTYTTHHTPLVIHPSSYGPHRPPGNALALPRRGAVSLFLTLKTPPTARRNCIITFNCSCPVASARRCGLLILLCHRHNPVRYCELLILQEAQTLHRWRCVDQKSGARAFDWGTRVFERTGTLL